MRRLAFIAPLAAVLAVAGAAAAQQPRVTVDIGGDLTDQVENLGPREVQEQTDRLAQAVGQAVDRTPGLEGAEVHLVLTDLKPNRPTFQQAVDRPGLSIIDSFSIGGATIEGEIVTADGRRMPVRYSRYTSNLRDAYGYGTWQDANRAFNQLASNIASGRLVSR